MHPVVRMQGIVLATVLKWINRNRWREDLLLKKIRVTRRDRDGGEQTALKNQRVSLRGVFVWDVNSTVTKHSDYFVWKDTSEHVARRCDDTSWQETSEFLCIKTPPFLEGVQQQKKSPKNPGNAFSGALLMSSFQNFDAGAATNKNHPERGFLKQHFVRF